MADTNQSGDGAGAGSMTLEQAVAMLSQLAPQVAKLTEAMASLSAPAKPAEVIEDKAAPAAAGAEKPAEGAPVVKAEDKPEAAGVGMDAAQMERSLLGRIARRDALVKQLSAHVGTFDHADKTLDDVVAYGCEKLGLKVDKGSEAAALSGYLQAKPVATPAATVTGMDGAAPRAGSFVTKHLGGK